MSEQSHYLAMYPRVEIVLDPPHFDAQKDLSHHQSAHAYAHSLTGIGKVDLVKDDHDASSSVVSDDIDCRIDGMRSWG
jgi:hypothetical protein